MADRKRICVVDDDPDICEFCQFVLEGKGFYVQTCGSAASDLEVSTWPVAELI